MVSEPSDRVSFRSPFPSPKAFQSTISCLRRQLPSLAKTYVCLGKASSSSPVTFLLCLGPDIPGSSSTVVIRPPFRALFNPNVIQSQVKWICVRGTLVSGQDYEDHLVTPEDAILDVDKVQWKKIDAQLCSILWQSIDPKILHHLRAYKTCFKFWTQAKGLYTNDIQRFYKVVSDTVHVRQQDMDLSAYIGRIASLKKEFLTLMPFTNGAEAQQIQTDKFFMVLTLISLRPDLESTLSTDGPSDSSMLASQTNSQEGRSGNRGRGQCPQCTYCNKLGHTRDRCYQLHGWPPRTAHIAQSSDLLLSQLGSATSSTSQSITLTDSGASDHISGNKHIFSSITTTTSTLPTLTLANGSQTITSHHLHLLQLAFPSMILLIQSHLVSVAEGALYLERRLNNQAKSRLDHFIVSEGWECHFNGVVQCALPNQYLIIPYSLYGGRVRRGLSSFRFKLMWLKEEGYKDLLKSWWEGYKFSASASFIWSKVESFEIGPEKLE
ncbi:hypothetical protein CK203_108693 [Vitis vinifera]|uniref:Retrovirus-related Pol polyprotein from transposon RE1 n=1 Tax=Vitis vinifera TaxID=29760 RepID=A0A438BQ81_VITVI|nr:hypothetical protein CK203_108693 [Vitis vinifera]